MDRDFEAELAGIRHEILAAQQEIGKLEAQKDALATQRSEIKASCTRLGIKPTLLDVQNHIDKAEADLSTIISKIDKELKRD